MPDGTDVRKLAAIMFTDIAGYTAMVQQDEAEALRKVAIHRRHLEENTARYQGRVIQFYGDGSLSIYESVVDAVRCAIAMQEGYQEEGMVPVRIGIHLGDFVMKDGTVFGDGVNIASRIQAEGTPGAVLISEKVNAELHNHSSIDTVYLGAYDLKNVQHPVNVYAVSTPGITVPKGKRKSLLPRRRSYGILVVLTVLVAGYFAAQYFQDNNSAAGSWQEERIAIPEFTDLTNDPELATVSKMAAHWITTELIETVHASVVSYQSAVDNASVAYAEAGPKQLSERTGAVNVIEGTYLLNSTRDSLLFTTNIIDSRTGEYLREIGQQRVSCPSSDALDCIRQLANNLKGFWVSKTDKVLQPPTYEAYKDYLAARNLWFKDDVKALDLLNKSVNADPAFIDAWFLMIDLYWKQGNRMHIDSMLDEIKNSFPELTERQRNYLNYYDSRNKGRNIEAFNYFLKEYEIDPKDLFVNTSGMVMALEWVNAPRKSLEFFVEIDPDSLDLEQCTYCETRYIEAIYAYRTLNKSKHAREFVERLRPHIRQFNAYRSLVEFYMFVGDTVSVNQIISQAQSSFDARHVAYLYLVSSRQAQLHSSRNLSKEYARKSAAFCADSTRPLARSYYMMDSLNRALQIYDLALAKDSADNQIYGEMGVIYARQNDEKQAEKMIEKLASMKPEYDYGYTPYCQGRIAANLGQRDRALKFFKQSLQEGAVFRSSIDFMEDPDLMMLHKDPEFKKMLVRLPD